VAESALRQIAAEEAILEGEAIGYDLEKDRSRFMVSNDGIVIIPKRYIF